jgi:hypothetical protein
MWRLTGNQHVREESDELPHIGGNGWEDDVERVAKKIDESNSARSQWGGKV